MNPIYLDNNSTTMIDQKVLDKMMPYMTTYYGNASSSEHIYGWDSNEAVNYSREQISGLINCSPNEIFFTSGATESNNIAILGLIDLEQPNAHAITIKTEHKSVLDIFKHLSKKGINTTYIDVGIDGITNLKEIENSIVPDTKLISIMIANNEIGVIQPIKEIAKICQNKNIILHVDAAQALGKIDIDLIKINVDLMSFSAHKIYGPKGIGALYINRSTMKNKIKPITFGGGHEKGLRPGTLPVHNIVGFGEACHIAKKDYKKNNRLIDSLTNAMLDKLSKEFGEIIINGSKEYRIPGNLNISFPNLKQEPLIQKIRKVAVSSGSACTTSNPEPSHVLEAMGVSKSLIKSTIRIGIGKFNTLDEIQDAANYILEVVNKLKINKR